MNVQRLSSPLFWLVTLLLSVVILVVVTAVMPSGDALTVIMNVLLWVSTIAVVMTAITAVLALFRRIRGNAD